MKSKPRWMKSVIAAAKAEEHVIAIGRRKPARPEVEGKEEVRVKA